MPTNAAKNTAATKKQAAITAPAKSNVIPVDFGSSNTPVEIDYSAARKLTTEAGRRLLAAAAEPVPTAAKKGGAEMAADSVGKLLMVNPLRLRILKGHNSRIMTTTENQQHVDFLARNIAVNGVKVPLQGYYDDSVPDAPYVVTDGECRTLATLRAIEVYGADIAAVKFILEPRGSSVEDYIYTQFTGNSSKPLSPLEQANGVFRLLGMGQQLAQIANRLSLTAARLGQLLDLREKVTDQALKDMINSGEVSATYATELLKQYDNDNTAVVRVLKAAKVIAVERAEESGVVKHPVVDKVTGEETTPVTRILPKHVEEVRERRASGGKATPGKSVRVSKPVGRDTTISQKEAQNMVEKIAALEGFVARGKFVNATTFEFGSRGDLASFKRMLTQ